MKQCYWGEAPAKHKHHLGDVGGAAFEKEEQKKQEAENTCDYNRFANVVVPCLHPTRIVRGRANKGRSSRPSIANRRRGVWKSP